MPIVQTSVAELEYEEHGEGTPVLFLHGFPDSPRTWDGVVKGLEGIRAIVPYLRGYGSSRVTVDEAKSGEPAALALDILQLADALKIERFHIVGHDWGARAAFNASTLAPERISGILTLASPYVLCAGGKVPPPQIQAYWYQFFFQTKEGENELANDPLPFCRRLWEVWSPNWRFSDEEFIETARAWDNEQWAQTVLHSYRYRHHTELGVAFYAETAKLLADNPKVEVPAIYVQGLTDGADIPASADGQEEWFAHYERIDIPTVGHFIQRERPDVVADLVSKMLNSES